MTEIELNRILAELQSEEDGTISCKCRRKTGKAYRRAAFVQKNERLYQIVRRSYALHAGYVDWRFKGDVLTHSGFYIKYPQNSNCQRWIKRATSRRVRRCKELPRKGNYYRRLFDYWGTLY